MPGRASVCYNAMIHFVWLEYALYIAIYQSYEPRILNIFKSRGYSNKREFSPTDISAYERQGLRSGQCKFRGSLGPTLFGGTEGGNIHGDISL